MVITALVKKIAAGNEINPSRIGPHSLRSGGANAMFVVGYDTDVIKIWGRWKSASFTTYLRNDDRILTGVGCGMMLATGLLPQLQRQSGDDLNKERGINDGRAGGKGGRGKSPDSRMFLISKKMSQLCRHDARTYRQKNGFVDLRDILNHHDMIELSATKEDIIRIVNGEGRNYKKRFEFGHMRDGSEAVRTSKGHSANSGVTSEYLEDIGGPGMIVRGASLSNARSICDQGVAAMDRLHIHLGSVKSDRRGERFAGIRNHSEVGVVFGGAEFIQRGIKFYKSANDVILTEGLGGVLPAGLVMKVVSVRESRVLYTRSQGWLDKGSEGDRSERRDECPRRVYLTPAPVSSVRRISEGQLAGYGSRSSSYVSTDSSPYVIETPDSRKRVLVNEDPFGGSSRVKIELTEGECDGEPRFADPRLCKQEADIEEGDMEKEEKIEKEEGMTTTNVKEEEEDWKEEKDEKNEMGQEGIKPEIITPYPLSPTSMTLDNSPESPAIDLGFSGLESPDEMDFDTVITRTANMIDGGDPATNFNSVLTRTAATMIRNDLSVRGSGSGAPTQVVTMEEKTQRIAGGRLR